MKTATTWRAGAIGAALSLVAVGLVPNAAVGAEEGPEGNVASVTSGETVTDYATLAEAVDAAVSGSTITLLDDVTLTSRVTFDNGRTLTLDLDGKTITVDGANYLEAQNTDLTITGPGKFDVTTRYHDDVLRVKGGVDATDTEHTVVSIVEGVEMTGWPAVFVVDSKIEGEDSNNGIVVTIDNATLTAHYYAIYVQGNLNEQNTDVVPVINVSNSTITADGEKASNGLYLAGAANTTISDTVIDTTDSDGSGIEIRAGELTLNNVTILTRTDNYYVNPDGSGATARNAAIAVMQHTNLESGPKPVSLTVNGGTYTGGAALLIGNPQDNESFPTGVDVSIEDGLFVGVISSENEVDAEARVLEFISGGSFTHNLSAAPYFVDPGMALLSGDGAIYGEALSHVMSPADARAAAEAVVDRDGIEVFFENAGQASSYAESWDADVTFYIHTVTFDYNDGEGSTVVKVNAGDKVAKPANPTRAGYTFTGWNEGDSAYDFDSAVSGDLTLVAQWKKDTPDVPDPKPEPKPEPKPTPVNLVDVSSNKNSKNYTQFHSQIQWLANEGITRGWNVGGGKHEFRPKEEITREAMAAFMYRAAGSPAVTLPKQSPFADVTPQNTNFYKEIVWLNQQGISKGWNVPQGKNEFRPKANITRDAMAAFMYRFAETPAFTAPSKSPFADVTPKTQFYKEIAWLADARISTGWTATNEYRPYDEISREAMAAFLYRLDRL